MKKMRAHIFKVFVIVLVCCGLGMAVAQPAEAVSSTRDFTNWLQSVAKKAHASDLDHKLASLKKSNVNLYRLIEEASQIVSQNNDDFNLPLDSSSASDRVHHILLVEWNQFQTGNSMAAVPPVPTIKPFVSFQSLKALDPPVDLFSISADPVGYLPAPFKNRDAVGSGSHFITPMSGGIAIGAP